MLSTACLAAALVTGHPADDGPTRVQPVVLTRPADHGVGRRLDDVRFIDLDGNEQSLDDVMGERGLVIAAHDVGCPLSKKYGPRFGRLVEQSEARGFGLLLLSTNTSDDAAKLRDASTRYGFGETPWASPSDTRLQTALGVTSTTEVFVIDAAHTLRYRGAVDDQYGIGYAKPDPTHTYVDDALDAVATNTIVPVRATTAPGCALDVQAAENDDAAVTWHGRVSRIVQDNCLVCHRAGGPGPFSMQTYDEVRPRAAMIRYVVGEGLMPPWHADAESGPWLNDRSLAEDDRRDLLAWIEAGAPEGDAGEAPLDIAFADGWTIGEPDAIVETQSFDIPAEGVLDYTYTFVKTDFDEDKWIQAVEVRASAPEVVHHALVFIEEPGREGESRRERRRRWQGGLRGYFAGLVPGQGGLVYPDGYGKKLPKGAWLKFQLHYTPNGTATTDTPSIGFVFADGPPTHEVTTSAGFDTEFRIPAGASDHVVTARTTFREDGRILSFAPHMHLRGKSFRYDLRRPDGTVETLLDVAGYDFNWQHCYRLRDPVAVEAGSRLEMTAVFDNSSDNPANPNPQRAVHFGEQTWDEMMIGYFEWTK